MELTPAVELHGTSTRRRRISSELSQSGCWRLAEAKRTPVELFVNKQMVAADRAARLHPA